MDESTYTVELTLPELHAVSKSLGITLDVLAKRIMKEHPTSHRRRSLHDEWDRTNTAQIAVSNTLTEAMEEAA